MLIAQISDLHVRPDGETYAGRVDANAMAATAVRHLNDLDPRPDLVIVTGDLVDNGSDEEYAAARTILDGIAIPYVVIPGNHDARAPFRRTFADHAYLPADGPLNYVLDAHPLRILALDTTVAGKHYGELEAASLAWLARQLDADAVTPTLILMHHHPFASGIQSLDSYRLMNAAAAEEIIAAHDNIERVLCGHVHRLMLRRLGRTIAMACPSTASQIALRLAPEAQGASVMEPPGCLLHHWQGGGGLVSHLSPIGDYGAPMSFF
jgi:3',5'-cyclic AMP phosphodiesterase CpdA